MSWMRWDSKIDSDKPNTPVARPCEENFSQAGFESTRFGVIPQKARHNSKRLRLAVG